MADIRVDQLTIFPIKSLGGASVAAMRVTGVGPELDRRWMLVDDRGVVVTQRQNPVLSRCSVSINQAHITVDCEGRTAELPLDMSGGESVSVEIWGDAVTAVCGPAEAAEWFSVLLGFQCRPVYMPADAVRRVDQFFAPDESYTTFTDGFPILITSTASLADLNQRLDSVVPIGRFRANIVVTGGEPFAEDSWGQISVGAATLRGVKPCSRCVMTTIDPTTLIKSKEPLRTLATYRKFGNHVYFGENFIVEGGGEICIGDRLTVESVRSASEVARSRT